MHLLISEVANQMPSCAFLMAKKENVLA